MTEEHIAERLRWKASQLMESMPPRIRHTISGVVKDIDGLLIPLMCSQLDHRKLERFGPMTIRCMEDMFKKLRPYYEEIKDLPADALTDDAFMVCQSTPKRFRLEPANEEKDRQAQIMFEKMLLEKTDVRTRNLVNSHLYDYHKAEQYLNNPEIIVKWYGAGPQVQSKAMQFLHEFYQAFQQLNNETSFQTTLRLTANDFPFLTDEECLFAAEHQEAHGHLPMLYIAMRFLLEAKVKHVQVKARVFGLRPPQESLQRLAKEYGVTRERVRQLCQFNIREECPWPTVWYSDRWKSYPFMELPLLTAETIDWENLRTRERLENLSCYSALSILSLVRPLDVLALTADGTKINGHRMNIKGWTEPHAVLAYDRQYSDFPLAAAMSEVGHKACLLRLTDEHLSLADVVARHLPETADDQLAEQASSILTGALSLFSNVDVQGDDIVLGANRINYRETIYQILERHGESMSIHAIYEEFRKLHPEDHHTSAGFVRNYMLTDDRFEAVGRKSVYQLRQWGQFSGSLGQLAAHLLQQQDDPMPVDELCQKMLEERPNTTIKSCATSVYLATVSGSLLYYIDTQDNSTLVGLSDRGYADRFWPSPVSAEGARRSMRRFILENKRWPFSRPRVVMERQLLYVMRKYNSRKHVSEEEWQRYQKTMDDIKAYRYPACVKDQTFADNSRQMTAFVKRHHRMPERQEKPKLLNWYLLTLSRQTGLNDFQARCFAELLETVEASTARQKPSAAPTKVTQLSLDFGE